jgi:hypothetical protein
VAKTADFSDPLRLTCGEFAVSLPEGKNKAPLRFFPGWRQLEINFLRSVILMLKP